MFPDMRTIIFNSILVGLVSLVIILGLWRQSRRRFAGIGLLVMDFTLQATALFFIVLRGRIPDWISMVLAATLVMGGAILGYMGLERFVDKRSSQIHNVIILASFTSVQAYFSLVRPDLAVRNLNVSLGLLLIFLQCLWLLLYRVEPGLRPLTRGVALVFGAYCLVNGVRIVEFFIGSHIETNFLESGLFDRWMLISYQLLWLLLTYSLVLMVNQRLFLDREKLIRELQQASTQVKQLSGLLPICSFCKKIRDDQGSWTRIETYIRHHSEADFSHSLCPECERKFYPEYAGEG
jgi:hypothetical protein